KDLLKLNKELVLLLQGDGDKTGVYSALSINAQALILYHMLELIEQQGLDVLLLYLEKLNKDQKKKSSSKAVKILAVDPRLRRIYIELKKNEELSPNNLIHPKYNVLVDILLDELKKNPASRILVFVKLRDSIKIIVKKLAHLDGITPIRFVGQSTKSADDKGLPQKQQLEILQEFKDNAGTYNVLVSTNVGEEGLDIAECDLVVFYDVVASEIRLIQRKGRTARHRKGRVIILYSKGTHDEVLLRIAMSKLKKMNVNLKNPKEPIELSEPGNKVIDHGTTQHLQSNLRTFIESPLSQQTIPIIVQDPVIKISKLLPMKFGVRKRLKENDIEFEIVDSDLHISILNKVLIQVYSPRKIRDISFFSEIQDLREICELLLIIFDFVEFEEEYVGERRFLRNKIQELKNQENSQIIVIRNEEELFFIIQSVLESGKEDS
ncbi:MAG: helicase-related protein, partial [Promethearchaeota archaeon]